MCEEESELSCYNLIFLGKRGNQVAMGTRTRPHRATLDMRIWLPLNIYRKRKHPFPLPTYPNGHKSSFCFPKTMPQLDQFKRPSSVIQVPKLNS